LTLEIFEHLRIPTRGPTPLELMRAKSYKPSKLQQYFRRRHKKSCFLLRNMKYMMRASDHD